MATGVTKTFSDSVSKYVTNYGSYKFYMQLTMTETYSTSTGKSSLTFSNFNLMVQWPHGTKTAFIDGTIKATVNGTVYTIWNSNSAQSGTYKATLNASYNPVLVNSTGAAWTYTLSNLSRNSSGALSVTVEWSGITTATYLSGFGISINGSESVNLTTLTPCTITYNANGGTGAPSPQSGYVNVALTLSSTKPTRSSSSSNFTITGNANGGSANTSVTATKTISYSFKGWSTSSTATSASYSAGGSYTPSGNVTLYAVWGSSTSYSNNTLASLPSPTKASTTEDYSIVTCKLQGGQDENGNSADIALTSTKTTTYSFTGWGTSSTSGVDLSSTSAYTSSATVYAQWASTIGDATSVTLPYVTKTGYELSGWSITEGLKEGEITTSTYTPTDTSVILYACWNPSGMGHLYVNSEHVSALCWIYTNGEWYLCIPYMYSGGKWNICV